MSKLIINSSISKLYGPRDILEKLHKELSFRNKAAESQLMRMKKSLQWKERQLFHENGGELPDWYGTWKKGKLKELTDSLVIFCTTMKDDYLEVPTGLVSKVKMFYVEQKLDLVIEDERDFERPRRKLDGEKAPSLRTPQSKAMDRIMADGLGTERGLGMIRIATGVGKTVLAQETIRRFGHRAIFLVPSLPILNQTIKRFEAAFGAKNVKAYGGGKKNVGYVTIATYQSVYKGDPEDFKDIDLVVADEVHHCGAETFNHVLMNQLGNATHRYGLTAFEERADNATMLIEAAVGPVVYQYDAPEAIADGYLAKPTFMIYDVWRTAGQWTEYKEKNGVRTAVRQKPSVEYDGDNDIVAYRNWVLGNDILNDFVANLINGFVSDNQSILVLVDEIAHGERLTELLNNLGVESGYCVGGGKDNESLMKKFNARKLKVLIGTSTLGEGADTVPVDVLINLAGGASKSKTLQANGRALRNETDENGVAQKPTSLIIDFDFPLNKMLQRHSKVRQTIHKTLGEIHKGSIK